MENTVIGIISLLATICASIVLYSLINDLIKNENMFNCCNDIALAFYGLYLLVFVKGLFLLVAGIIGLYRTIKYFIFYIG